MNSENPDPAAGSATASAGPAEQAGAVMTVHRRIRTGARPVSVPCAGCGTAVAVAARGPIPKWCGQTCRQRGWELRRAAGQLSDPSVSVAVREMVEVPVTIRPERMEWVGELAELTRQIATAELPAGCFHPVYEALTVAINQLTHTGRPYIGERQFGFVPHPAMAGRERIIADQLDTTSLSVTGRDPAVARRLQIAYERSDRRRTTRMQRRFPNSF